MYYRALFCNSIADTARYYWLVKSHADLLPNAVLGSTNRHDALTAPFVSWSCAAPIDPAYTERTTIHHFQNQFKALFMKYCLMNRHVVLPPSVCRVWLPLSWSLWHWPLLCDWVLPTGSLISKCHTLNTSAQLPSMPICSSLCGNHDCMLLSLLHTRCSDPRAGLMHCTRLCPMLACC